MMEEAVKTTSTSHHGMKAFTQIIPTTASSHNLMSFLQASSTDTGEGIKFLPSLQGEYLSCLPRKRAGVGE